MKKLLLSFIATSAIFFSNAQTKISFEASEGYNQGSIDGQKEWLAATANFKVSNVF